MKTKHLAPFVLVLALLFCVPAHADIVFEDTFDGYATATEFRQTWAAEGSPVYDLDTTFGVTGGSVRMPSPSYGNGTTNRYYRNLGQIVHGSDASPLVFSFDLYLDPAAASSNWDTAWHSADIRGYSGGAYKQGDLRDLVGIGACGDASAPLSCFQGRVFNNGVSYMADGGWFDLNAPGATTRSSGWHHLEARITTRRIEFYVDGVLSTALRGGLRGIDSVVIGTGYPANGHTMWLDNIRLEITPEPASLLLMLAAVAALRRQRQILENPPT